MHITILAKQLGLILGTCISSYHMVGSHAHTIKAFKPAL